MTGPNVLIFHRPASPAEATLVALLADVRRRLAGAQQEAFLRSGAAEVAIVEERAASFGELLSDVAPSGGGVIVLGSGAVARLDQRDARRLVEAAGGGGRRALTNNRYSSDVCAVSDASALADLPALPSDNALPRWLEERAGFTIGELPGRERLALDIDTPLDAALWALTPRHPRWLDAVLAREDITVPRLAELRSLTVDPHAELLVFGRAGSDTLRWLERHVRCRVRFLAEERGLRASSPLAIARARQSGRHRSPRATLGRLLKRDGPSALAGIVAELADGAILDSRVLLADRFGRDEADWPAPADRYASDLLRPAEIVDPWLRALTDSAAASRVPILLGAHTLVGPGVRLVLTD